LHRFDFIMPKKTSAQSPAAESPTIVERALQSRVDKVASEMDARMVRMEAMIERLSLAVLGPAEPVNPTEELAAGPAPHPASRSILSPPPNFEEQRTPPVAQLPRAPSAPPQDDSEEEFGELLTEAMPSMSAANLRTMRRLVDNFDTALPQWPRTTEEVAMLALQRPRSRLADRLVSKSLKGIAGFADAALVAAVRSISGLNNAARALELEGVLCQTGEQPDGCDLPMISAYAWLALEQVLNLRSALEAVADGQSEAADQAQEELMHQEGAVQLDTPFARRLRELRAERLKAKAKLLAGRKPDGHASPAPAAAAAQSGGAAGGGGGKRNRGRRGGGGGGGVGDAGYSSGGGGRSRAAAPAAADGQAPAKPRSPSPAKGAQKPAAKP
jgi:uncharacterized membrane protein YgcG